jgi:hypothetical protein
MATLTAVLAVFLVGLNIGISLHTYWTYWHPRPHPLDDRLRDIAIAIRGMKP